MNEEVYFRDIKYNKDQFIYQLPYKEIFDWTRIYYNYEGEQSGFDFYVINQISCPQDYEWSVNIDNDLACSVEILYYGTFRFDGLRHFYMGNKETNNEGYLYYVDLNKHIEILKKLAEMELEMCSQPHWK